LHNRPDSIEDAADWYVVSVLEIRYTGPAMTAKQEAEVLEFIDWIREQDEA
jgi:hypothetical protein